MKQGQKPAAGFTIIEVLIVLAVSMALFVSAAALIAGKERRTEFDLGARQVQQQLQQTINEVSNGYYTSDGTVSCIGSPATGPIVSSAPKDRGTNQDCIFFGKVIQFSQASGDPQEFYVYSMVGLRDTGASVVANLSSIKPTIVDFSPAVYDTIKLPYGMTVQNVYYGAAPPVSARQVGAIGFASSEGHFGGDDVSGQLNTLAVPGTQIGDSQTAGANKIKTNLGSSTVDDANGLHICLLSGGTNQSALYTIGDQGKNTTVSIAIKDNLTCA